MSIIKAIISAVAYVFKWLSNRNDPVAVQQRKADAQTKDIENIAGEVHRKDSDAINKRIHDLRKAGLVFVMVYAMGVCGCTTPRVIYVPEQDKVVPLELNGRPGWWVPEMVMVDLLERATENHNRNEAKGTTP